MLPVSLHYEDDSLLIAEKPAGIPCLPEEAGQHPTLVDLLNLNSSPLPDFGLVHRLDNDTSGLTVIAKDRTTYDHLRQQFSEGRVEKEYVALAVGILPERGTIDTPLAHHPRKKKKMVACTSSTTTAELKGRPATTAYTSIARYTLENRTSYTLLQVSIASGVRHQIRVHLSSIGHPLAGDRLYQNSKKRNEDRLHLARHFLHAVRLAIMHPLHGKRIECSSSLPVDLTTALRSLTLVQGTPIASA